jgi:hypothetical protein
MPDLPELPDLPECQTYLNSKLAICLILTDLQF